MNGLYKFYEELKRRNVIKAAVSYLVVSWVVLQVVALIGDILRAPEWLGKGLLIGLLILFPVWLLISWYYEITPNGLKRTVPRDGQLNPKRAEVIGKKLNVFIVIFLAIAVVLLILDRTRLVAHQETDTLALNRTFKNSIAVLPFHDMSLKKNQEYFADGLAEELLNSLARIPEMHVISRTSAFSFKRKDIDIKNIAEKLNVNYILEGSVRTQDSLIRVSVKLIDTRNDRNLWAQTWDKKVRNIFQIQNDIAQSVTKHMELHILKGKVPKVREAEARAYELYLQAKYDYQNSIGKEGLVEIENKLKKVLEIDPNYAPAWQLLGTTYHTQNNYGVINVVDGKRLATEAVLKAIELDSSYAESYAVMATLALDYDRNIKKAEEWTDLAMQWAPNDAAVLDRTSEVAILRGDIKKAIKLNKQAIQLDPLDDSNYSTLANTQYFAEQYDAAISSIKKALEINPDNDVVYLTYAMALVQQKRYREALNVIDNDPLEGFRHNVKGIIYHFLHNTEASKHEMQQLIDNHQESFSFQIAISYAAIGDREKMYYWLEKAKEYNDLGLTELPLEPMFNPYRNEQRWKEYVRSIDYKY